MNPRIRPINLLFASLLVIGCTPDEPDALRFGCFDCAPAETGGSETGGVADLPEPPSGYQICMLSNASYVFKEKNPLCPDGYWHACWAGSYPAESWGTACCVPDGAQDDCRIDPNGVCLVQEETVCNLPMY